MTKNGFILKLACIQGRFRALLLILICSFTYSSNAQTIEDASYDFNLILDQLDQAITKFVNGNAESFREMWSDSDQITIAGAFGGQIVQGNEEIQDRLSRVGSSYSETGFSTERISYGNDGRLGYLIQREFFNFFDEDGLLLSTREYRVTMLFTLESDGWKILHRHADLSTEWVGME